MLFPDQAQLLARAMAHSSFVVLLPSEAQAHIQVELI
jgi:hypothetical protein